MGINPLLDGIKDLHDGGRETAREYKAYLDDPDNEHARGYLEEAYEWLTDIIEDKDI